MQKTSLAGAGLGLPFVEKSELNKKSKTRSSKSKINLAILGCGLRGQWHCNLALNRDDCNVIAIAEPDGDMIQRTKKVFSNSGKPEPKYYSDGDKDYLNLLENEDLDAVIIASPWRWHSEMAIAALNRKIYVGMEVCGAFSIDECWQLVNASEQNQTPLYFLENVCFRRDVMAVLNMVRQDLFGELIHLEGGYQHDLRGVKLNDGKSPYGSGVKFGEEGYSESKWRTKHSIYRNGELYPTHGIGPLAQYININRGNRFLYLTSIASKARGLKEYIVNHPSGGQNHPNAKINFTLGDKITTMIKTSNEETIVLHHDTNLPRPYSLGFRVQGTKGLWMSVNKSLHLEGSSEAHRWEDTKPYFEKYDHPLWKKFSKDAEGGGHGGMDFFLMKSFVEHVKDSKEPVFDVYDAATWLSITALSEESISLGSHPVAFPDFTRGRWTEARPENML